MILEGNLFLRDNTLKENIEKVEEKIRIVRKIKNSKGGLTVQRKNARKLKMIFEGIMK